jgi:hypothetical protein
VFFGLEGRLEVTSTESDSREGRYEDIQLVQLHYHVGEMLLSEIDSLFYVLNIFSSQSCKTQIAGSGSAQGYATEYRQDRGQLLAQNDLAHMLSPMQLHISHQESFPRASVYLPLILAYVSMPSVT